MGAGSLRRLIAQRGAAFLLALALGAAPAAAQLLPDGFFEQAPDGRRAGRRRGRHADL